MISRQYLLLVCFLLSIAQSILIIHNNNQQSLPNIDDIKNTITNVKDAIVNKTQEKINDIPEQDRQALKSSLKDIAQSKVSETLDQASTVVNHPITKVVSGLMGDTVKNGVKQASDVLDGLKKNAGVVGEGRAKENIKKESK